MTRQCATRAHVHRLLLKPRFGCYVCLQTKCTSVCTIYFSVELDLCALLDFILRRHACGWRMMVHIYGWCVCLRVCLCDQSTIAHFLSFCSFVVLHFLWLWCRGVSADARRLPLVTGRVCLSASVVIVCACVCVCLTRSPLHTFFLFAALSFCISDDFGVGESVQTLVDCHL